MDNKDLEDTNDHMKRVAKHQPLTSWDKFRICMRYMVLGGIIDLGNGIKLSYHKEKDIFVWGSSLSIYVSDITLNNMWDHAQQINEDEIFLMAASNALKVNRNDLRNL